MAPKNTGKKTTVIKGDFAPYIKKYLKLAYKSASSDWEDFPAGVKMMILREATRDWGWRYSIFLQEHMVTSTYHKVSISVSLMDNKNTEVASTVGVSTQYMFDFVRGAKSSCSERAQTIALGKALSMLGIAVNSNMFSADEMLVFETMKDFDAKAQIDDLSRRVQALPEDFKKAINIKGLKIRDMLSIYDESDSPEVFQDKVGKFISDAE